MDKNTLFARLFALLLAALLLCSAAFAEETDEAALEQQYEAAAALMEAGDYEAAMKAFEALGDYSDSKTQLSAAKRQWKRQSYKNAVALFKEERYYEARDIFEALGNYENSSDYAYKCMLRIRIIEYAEAEAFFKEGDYESAKTLFEGLGKYRDSRDRAAEAEAMIQAGIQAEREAELFKEAEALCAEGRYEEAREALILAGPYPGATELLYEVAEIIARENVYARAVQAHADGDDAKALLMFETLGDYEDSVQQADAIRNSGVDVSYADENQRQYDKAVLLHELRRDDEANAIYESLGKFSNAAAMIRPEIRVIRAEELRDDSTSPLSEVFVAPDGSRHVYRIYKGVHKWVEAKAFCELMGGHLATMTTPEENAFVYKFMRDSGYLTAYFGLCDEKRVGDWVWVTGEPFEYTFWHRGEPSRSGRERYGMYFYKHTDGSWNDAHFYEDAEVDPGCSYICEWDLPAEE